MLLNVSDHSSQALHEQIFLQVRAMILSGDRQPGEALPSIRGLARELRVSVITVQRAYADLERAGLIHARRGKGFFVADLPAAERLRMAEAKAREALAAAVREALAEGVGAERLRELVEEVVEQEEPWQRGVTS